MTQKLAGLVLPDSTPVEKAPQLKHEAPARPVAAPKPAPRTLPRRRRGLSTTDWMIGAGGVALAAACAMFPWYILFNPEEFGTRPIAFRSAGALGSVEETSATPPALVGARLALQNGAFPDIDRQSTGTVSSAGTAAVPASEQPFPGTRPAFDLVLVANGRGMIADSDGYWVVQPGSWLPDGSRVSSLEMRDGQWVLVTSKQAVIRMAK